MSTSPDDRVTLRFLATPADTAAGGRSVAAGSVMEWIDKAGYACAVGWGGAYCVTAYVGNVRHRRPIPPGSLIEVRARIVHTGRTSMHVVVTVSSAEVSTRAYTPATTCVLIFVAKDADGRPTPVPPWTPASRSDRKLAEAAIERIDTRAEIKRLMLGEEYTAASRAPRTTLRFLVPTGVVNFGGRAHGGTVMRWIDEAAYACAVGWVGGRPLADHAIGVYSGGIHFLAPVRIGDLVEVDARIILTGPHSMHVSTRVWTADPRTPDQLTLTTQCLSVFVVPDDSGVALPVPQWKPELPEDVRLHEHARAIVGLRETIVPIAASLTLEP
ncbi:MAG TPA: hotdog domain-containing protein [Pseudolysinimonas sp.]|nr:hotdog domain-containing protein [Pseudolysinimonas sp.]